MLLDLVLILGGALMLGVHNVHGALQQRTSCINALLATTHFLHSVKL